MSDFAPASLTLEALRARGEPSFFERDTSVWKQLLVTWFEAETERVLYPDQTEMFLIEMLAYSLALQGEGAQAAVLQNVAVWAQGSHLDDVAAGASIFRLQAQPARTRLRFTLAGPSARVTTIPKGTRVGIEGAVFETDREATIAAGQLAAEVDAVATIAGTAANGFAPGQIRASLASIAPGMTAANITATAGGAERESDEHLRAVTVDAPEAFDRRGGWGGYGLAVRRVSPDIAEVAVDRPQAGHIHIVPMILGDVPASAGLLEQVRIALNPETVTPQGDFVTVRAPVPFVIETIEGEPEERFHPNIAAEFIPVPGDVVSGSILTGTTWTHPEPSEPEPQPVPQPRRLQVTPPEFMLLFASAERIAIRQARAYTGDDAARKQAALVIDDWFAIIEDPRLTAVDLSRGDTLDGLGFLVISGILTEARAGEIASGLPMGSAP